MGSNNSWYHQTGYGLGLDLWYRNQPYNEVPNETWTDDAKSVGSHVVDTVNPEILSSIFKGGEPGRGEVTLSRFVKSKLNQNTNNTVNKTSISAIIEHLQKWQSTYVTYADFAYLKHIGVYPTNRLMIARRFSSPVGNNLYKVNASPMATMISWVPDNTDFFSTTFGENWEGGETSFIEILNSMGKDWKIESLGNQTEGGIMTFPGWSENLQIKIAKKLGLVEDEEAGGYTNNNPPLGNPNLILEVKRRSLVDRSAKGGDSGLKSSFSIKFTVEYEQKFINDVDPSLIYLDLIHKALIFGTSKSIFYYGGTAVGAFGNFFNALYSGDVTGLIRQMWELITSIAGALVDTLAETDFTNLENLAQNTIGQIVSKYRLKLFAVIQALTGSPSGCWHVTIGNPIKPIFSSGDLYISENVTLTLGKQLSYNDLPSSIKIEFTLTPTRNLGGQEIFDRFNTGVGRTYFQDVRSWVEVPLFGASESNTAIDNIVTKSQVNARLQSFRENLKKTIEESKAP